MGAIIENIFKVGTILIVLTTLSLSIAHAFDDEEAMRQKEIDRCEEACYKQANKCNAQVRQSQQNKINRMAKGEIVDWSEDRPLECLSEWTSCKADCR